MWGFFFHSSGLNSSDDLFSWSRESSALAEEYSAYIAEKLSQLSVGSGSICAGALIMEPGKSLFPCIESSSLFSFGFGNRPMIHVPELHLTVGTLTLVTRTFPMVKVKRVAGACSKYAVTTLQLSMELVGCI